MKLRNPGPDRFIYGLHFAEGAVVEIPADMDPTTVACLCREFEVVEDAHAIVEADPIAVAAEDGEQPAPPEVPQDGWPPKRRYRRRV